MEATALPETAASPQALLGRSPLLRLQSDEKLIALTRRGNPAAFDALVHRYQARLLAFLRHMLASTEDAEDVLQEVFASAFNAIRADERPINARPWLYRIARNRALNHLRRPAAAGQDTMDVFERAAGETTADAVHRREDFRLLIADVQELPETQRTALLMREIDALSYEQIAEAMETTVPSVKSLLVRARVGLAEAAEARTLACTEVRLALAEVEEGAAKLSATVRRHVKGCESCSAFRADLKRSTKAMAALFPAGPLALLKHVVWTKLTGASGGVSAGAAGSSAVGSSTMAGGSAWSGGAAASSSAVGGLFGGGGLSTTGLISSGVGALASKAAAGLVAAAVFTAGAAEVVHLTQAAPKAPPTPAAVNGGGAAPGPVAAGSSGEGTGLSGVASNPIGPDARADGVGSRTDGSSPAGAAGTNAQPGGGSTGGAAPPASQGPPGSAQPAGPGSTPSQPSVNPTLPGPGENASSGGPPSGGGAGAGSDAGAGGSSGGGTAGPVSETQSGGSGGAEREPAGKPPAPAPGDPAPRTGSSGPSN